ncbi:MAG TPA: S46 family peptidase [Chthoniobacterales bacterium]|nr:S46 family peptidase [Chthoniobacterales bacterium]
MSHASRSLRFLGWSILSLTIAFGTPAFADEGMWLFNSPPLKQLKERYHFDPARLWLDRLQKASVRFNSGGSGSFVSATGLVITNHHIGADALQKFSDEQHNYLRDGFYARTRTEEKKCIDLELNVLMSIEDVTARVNGAVKSEMTSEQASDARKSVIAAIEKESKDKTGLRSDVVTLYQGGAYHLYRYKRYDDVRLVFAPEQQIAFYGGDPDNFEYPRFDLDICLFRVYENGQPAKIDNYLKFNPRGPVDGELTFVSGHPGKTDRQLTVDELADMRDRELPRILTMFKRREVLLHSFGERTFENERRVRDDFFGVQNNRKRYDGYLAGLLDPQIWQSLQAREQKLRDAISSDPKLTSTISAYDRVKNAQVEVAKNARVYNYFEMERPRFGVYRQPRAFYSTLFKYARLLVRAADERAKPNGERFEEFRDSARESLELELFSTEPVYDDVELLTLTDSFTDLASAFGANDPLVKMVLGDKSPVERASELIKGTQLKDVAFRKKLYAGGKSALEAVHDPMIDIAIAIDATGRQAKKVFETQEEIKQQAYAEIAKARFATEGTNTYPDATFTLRLSYGRVRGYEENGKQIPAFTNFAGMYERAGEHENKPPFDLPQRWIDKKNKLALTTPFDFVSDADIIGGNSGSPVVNQAGEFVGIIFDGNIQSLVLDCIFTDKQARAVSVDSAAILEALRNVYDAQPLVDELSSAK